MLFANLVVTALIAGAVASVTPRYALQYREPPRLCCPPLPGQKPLPIEKRDNIVRRLPNEDALIARFELELLQIYLMDILKNEQIHETLDSIDLGLAPGANVVLSLAYNIGSPSMANIPTSTNSTMPTKKNSILAYIRANAEFVWGMLEQRSNCSGESGLYTKMCPYWRAPTPIPTPDRTTETPVYENALSAGTMAHNLLVILSRVNNTIKTEMEDKLTPILLRQTDETRFACASFYCFTSFVEAQSNHFALDNVMSTIEKISNDLYFLGGRQYSGMLQQYYPQCRVLRSGCSKIADSAKFADCLMHSRNTPQSFGPGPQFDKGEEISNLPTCGTS